MSKKYDTSKNILSIVLLPSILTIVYRIDIGLGYLELFLEIFSTPCELSLTDLYNFRFKICDNLNDYYQKTITKVWHTLELDNRFILEALTGLSLETKLLVPSVPKTTPLPVSPKQQQNGEN